MKVNGQRRYKRGSRRETFGAGSIVLAGICIAALTGCSGLIPTGSTSTDPASIVASSKTIRAGEKATFMVTGGNQVSGQWKVIGSNANGQIDQNGVFQAPERVPDPNSVSIAYVMPKTVLTATVQILSPAPILQSVSPNWLHAITNQIAVQGSNFVNGSTVLVKGQGVPTTFVDSNNLIATVTFPAETVTKVDVAVTNPNPGSTTSVGLPVNVDTTSISVSPSTVAGGPIKLTLGGLGVPSSDLTAILDGRQLSVTETSNSALTLAGYLPPWHLGQARLQISINSSGVQLADVQLPIEQTKVTFDAAARFLMQAGFGPRPDLVQHVQQVGMDAFIAEQQALAPKPYKSTDPGIAAIMTRAVVGSTPLRMRVAWALQSFLMRSGIFLQQTNFPFEAKMEREATGNFRDVLTDISSDTSVALFLNLAGNAAPTDPAQHPNQNFARELLQLFSIGTQALNDDGTIQKNPDGSPVAAYDQDTIIDLSRALTGWNLAPSQDPNYTFYGVDWSAPLIATEWQHDHGQKRLFGNIVLPAGQSAESDRAMALDTIFMHPNLPPFVSRILIQRLVKSDPSPAYVQRVVAVFKDDGRGVRGNLSAVVRAILLDPEARSGDTALSETDGFLQEPYLFETFLMSMTGWSGSDAQPASLPCTLKECIFYSPTVFGFFSPSYKVPGTQINSPEFQIFDNLTLINRSQLLWAMVSNQQPGFPRENGAWLYQNFTSLPEFIDAVNHLAYHGSMSLEEQSFLNDYCSKQAPGDLVLQQQTALFLALNADAYTVTQ